MNSCSEHQNNDPVRHHLSIYYTSGTGNTHRVVHWITRRVIENGWRADRQLIEEVKPSLQSPGGPGQTLLIATPTHGFTTPWHVLRFALSLPRGKGSSAYCLATRAGFRIGSYITDGMAGTCAFLLALILASKGYRVRGTVHINMPSNWYSLHPMQGPKTVNMLIERARNQTLNFADSILVGRRIWLTGNNAYEAVVGLILAPVSAAYLVIGRFCLAKLFFANYRCNGCGICAKGCALHAIEMHGKNRPRPFWRHNCESCMRCAAICPRNAVEASHSWLAILIYISKISVFHSIFTGLGEMLPLLSELNQGWMKSLLRLAYWYPAIFLSYHLFQALLRIRVVNRLFTYTTFTHYWGRYKESSVNFKELSLGRIDINDD